ncbi:MAG: hypothetical protein WC759_00165 [Candidatus Micrarchaeia archaeon]|jgi:hypothetical protein
MAERSRKFNKGQKGFSKSGHHYTPPIDKLANRDRARLERLGKPEGKGTGRSEGSNEALRRILMARGRYV